MRMPSEIQTEITQLETQLNDLKAELKISKRERVKENIQIIYSLDGKFFYIRDGYNLAKGWMSVDPVIGVLTDEEKKSGAFGPAWITLTDSRSPVIRNRQWYAFNFHEMKSGSRVSFAWPKENEELTPQSSLVMDYIIVSKQHCRWEGYDGDLF